MRLERSDTWNTHSGPGKNVPVWRVTVASKLVWGPWCHSRRDAIWQWLKNVIRDTFQRGLHSLSQRLPARAGRLLRLLAR